MLSTIKVVAVLYIVFGAIHSVAFELFVSRTDCLTARGLTAIYCNSGKGISHLAVTLAWPMYWLQPTTARAQHLTGADRAAFVSSTIAGCMRRYGQDGTNVIPRPLFERYCQCYANGLADKLTASELKLEHPSVTKPVIQSEGRRCYQEMKADALRTLR